MALTLAIATAALPAQAPPELVLVGSRVATPVSFPGVLGRLAIDPFVVVSPTQLRQGDQLHPGLLRAFTVQQVTLGPAVQLGPPRSVASFFDGDLELREMAYAGPPQDSGALEYPTDCRVTLRLGAEPAHANFTRHLRFRADDSHEVLLALEFRRTSGLVWEATLPNGITPLRDLVESGGRSHWDHIALVNGGGTTALPIAHLLIELDYEVTNFFRGGVTETITIPLVDSAIGRTLGSAPAEMPLNDHARATRRAFAVVDGTFPRVVQYAAGDLGKSGSDGGSAANPKYGPGNELLCSEFVSWYYHHAGVSISAASDEFRDVVATQQLHDLFADAGRLYRYDSGSSSQRFEHPSTGAPYTPGPGDFLEWRMDGSAMHAMLLLSYDATTHTATVFNGPWPVWIMQVDLQWWETTAGAEHDFWIGSIPR